MGSKSSMPVKKLHKRINLLELQTQFKAHVLDRKFGEVYGILLTSPLFVNFKILPTTPVTVNISSKENHSATELFSYCVMDISSLDRGVLESTKLGLTKVQYDLFY